MILALLRQKLRERGARGFAIDAAKAATAYGIIAAQAIYIGSGASTVVAIAGELRRGARTHRCDADCAADRTSCRNAEEPGS